MRLLSLWQESSHKDKRGVKCKREEPKVSNITFTVSKDHSSTNGDETMILRWAAYRGKRSLCPCSPLDRFKLDRYLAVLPAISPLMNSEHVFFLVPLLVVSFVLWLWVKRRVASPRAIKYHWPKKDLSFYFLPPTTRPHKIQMICSVAAVRSPSHVFHLQLTFIARGMAFVCGL